MRKMAGLLKKVSTLLVLGAGSASFASQPVLHCPSDLQMRLSIDQLNLHDKEDASFAELSGRSLTERLEIQHSNDGCLYRISSQDVKGPFVQLSQSPRTGAVMVSIEGYTSKNKLYSIRTRLVAGQPLLSVILPMVLFDGSGPAKEVLGHASVMLTAQ